MKKYYIIDIVLVNITKHENKSLLEITLIHYLTNINYNLHKLKDVK